MLNNSFIFRFFSVASLFCSGFIFVAELPREYSLLPLLPLVCSLLFFLCGFYLRKSQLDVASVLIAVLMFVRYSFLSLLCLWGDFSAETSWPFTQDHFNDAILLMTYESLAIAVAIILGNIMHVVREKKYVVQENRNISFFIVLGCCLYVVGVILFYPDTMMLFNSFFQMNQLEFTQGSRIEQASVGNVKRIAQTLFSVIFGVTRIIFPVYLIRHVNEKIKSNFLIILMILFAITLQFLFITSTFAESILCSLVIFLAVSKINPNVGRKVIKIAPFFIVAIIVVYFYVRYTVSLSSPYNSMYARSTMSGYLCALFNAYFTGPFNVAGSFMPMDDSFFETFKSTFLSTIPFNTTIFGPRGASIQPIFNAYNHCYGQIPSSIGDGFYFFGFFFSPIYSFLMTFAAVLLSRKASFENTYWYYMAMVYSAIILSLGIAMYNEHISLYWLNQWAAPLFFIAFLSEKKVLIK